MDVFYPKGIHYDEHTSMLPSFHDAEAAIARVSSSQ
jgi:hypothetical protein